MTTTWYTIEGMHCGSCVARIENTVKAQVPGVETISVQLTTGKARVDGDASPETVTQVIQNLGYRVLPQSAPLKDDSRAMVQRTLFAAVLTLPVVVLGMTHQWPWVQAVLTVPVVLGAGWPIFRGALHRDMNTLIALGSGVALLASLYNVFTGRGPLYFEAAAVIVTLVLLGRTLESRARARAKEGLTALLNLQPQTALQQQPDGSLRSVPVAALQVGDRVLVRPGEAIATDGQVFEGISTVNQAMVTGESEPVLVQPGADVIGGTVNVGPQPLWVTVTRVGEDTVLSHIARQVEAAQASKVPLQRLADRIAGIFVPIVLILAALTGAGWALAGGPVISPMVAVLVVACPCALGLATPVAIQVGLARAARRGLLVREARTLELARKIDVLMFDKTGTLTQGQPTVQSVEWVQNAYSENQVRAWVSALAGQSTHPLAQSLLQWAIPNTEPVVAEHVQELAGLGIQAQIAGLALRLGSANWLIEQNIAVPPQSSTSVWLAVDGVAVVGFVVEDPLRPEAQQTLAKLRAQGLSLMLASGDHPDRVARLAQQVGIEHYRGGLSPQGKREWIAQLQAAGHRAAFTGDGINDAPALAQADWSLAVASGSDVAKTTADVVLLEGHLGQVLSALTLSRETVRTIYQNLFWASIYNLVGIPLAAFGVLPPMFAAGAMAFSSLSVVLNSLRQLRH
jgi:Cu+-exporting ATPase